MTVFVAKGDAPLTPAQLENRAQTYIRRSWTRQAREKSIRLSDGLFDAFMTSFSADHAINVENNVFNWQLSEYRKATARLAQYRLADGRSEVTEDIGTGEFDDDGNEITETVIVQTAVDPLPAQIEQPVYDDDGNQTGTTMVDNPLIVQDDAERAAAQVVIDSTPQSVKDF